MNGPLVLQLYVLHVRGELADVAGDHEAAWPFHRTTYFYCSCDRRVPGDLPLKVRANQRIEIEMGKLQRDLSWPVGAKMDFAVKIEIGIFKMRAPAQDRIFTLGLRR